MGLEHIGDLIRGAHGLHTFVGLQNAQVTAIGEDEPPQEGYNQRVHCVQ